MTQKYRNTMCIHKNNLYSNFMFYKLYKHNQIKRKYKLLIK